MTASKPSISATEADQAIARAIESLKAARTMIKGPRPAWDAFSQLIDATCDLLNEVKSPLLDWRIARYRGADDA